MPRIKYNSMHGSANTASVFAYTVDLQAAAIVIDKATMCVCGIANM